MSHYTVKTPVYFNSHSRKESDIIVWLGVVQQTYFNSHSRKESDNLSLVLQQQGFNFNSHSRKESDNIQSFNIKNDIEFQFTLS